jgi:hypothetical protein
LQRPGPPETPVGWAPKTVLLKAVSEETALRRQPPRRQSLRSTLQIHSPDFSLSAVLRRASTGVLSRLSRKSGGRARGRASTRPVPPERLGHFHKQDGPNKQIGRPEKAAGSTSGSSLPVHHRVGGHWPGATVPSAAPSGASNAALSAVLRGGARRRLGATGRPETAEQGTRGIKRGFAFCR